MTPKQRLAQRMRAAHTSGRMQYRGLILRRLAGVTWTIKSPGQKPFWSGRSLKAAIAAIDEMIESAANNEGSGG